MPHAVQATQADRPAPCDILCDLLLPSQAMRRKEHPKMHSDAGSLTTPKPHDRLSAVRAAIVIFAILSVVAVSSWAQASAASSSASAPGHYIFDTFLSASHAVQDRAAAQVKTDTSADMLHPRVLGNQRHSDRYSLIGCCFRALTVATVFRTTINRPRAPPVSLS